MKKMFLAVIFLVVITSGNISEAQYREANSDTTSFTSPGVSAAMYAGYVYNSLVWNFKVSGISGGVTLSLEYKIGDSSWTPVYADSTVITSNGYYAFTWNNPAIADSIRLKFISESGAKNAVITHNYKAIGW
jgi:hypothetical protein